MIAALDQILAAVEAQLAGITGSSGVHRKPFALLDETDLDCIVIDEIEDELIQYSGFWPRTEKRVLRFDVVPLVMGTRANCLAALGALHLEIETRLFGSLAAVTLGGLITKPLQNPSRALLADSETLQKPVCGWRIRIEITYHTRSDLPGYIDKES